MGNLLHGLIQESLNLNPVNIGLKEAANAIGWNTPASPSGVGTAGTATPGPQSAQAQTQQQTGQADNTISDAMTALQKTLQPVNPLAMQLFAQQVLMPWMHQIAGMTQKANTQYGQAENQIANEPFMKGNVAAQDMLAQVPQEQLGATNLVNAQLGAAASAPIMDRYQQAYSTLQGLIQQLIPQTQKLAAYYDPTYQALAGQAQQGILGVGSSPLGSLSSIVPGAAATQPQATLAPQTTTTQTTTNP